MLILCYNIEVISNNFIKLIIFISRLINRNYIIYGSDALRIEKLMDKADGIIKTLNNTQKEAIKIYGVSSSINIRLRKNETTIDDNKQIMLIDSSLQSDFLLENTILFRRINNDIFVNSNTYIEKSYTSTTLYYNDLSADGRFIYIIMVPKSIKCLKVDEITKCGENEILIERDIVYKKVFKKNFKGYTYILCKAEKILN